MGAIDRALVWALRWRLAFSRSRSQIARQAVSVLVHFYDCEQQSLLEDITQRRYWEAIRESEAETERRDQEQILKDSTSGYGAITGSNNK